MQIDLLNWLKRNILFFFKKFQRSLLKTISNYLFTKKKRFQFISQFHLYSIFFLKVIYTYCIKEFITKFQFRHKNYFYFPLQKLNEFLLFCLQKYFNLLSFKKSGLYNLLKKYNFISKRIFETTLFIKQIIDSYY